MTRYPKISGPDYRYREISLVSDMFVVSLRVFNYTSREKRPRNKQRSFELFYERDCWLFSVLRMVSYRFPVIGAIKKMQLQRIMNE